MAVTYRGAASTTFQGQTSASIAYTLGSYTNRRLIVGVSINGNVLGSLTYGGVNLSHIYSYASSVSGSYVGFFWYGLNELGISAASGNTLYAGFSTSCGGTVIAILFSDANQNDGAVDSYGNAGLTTNLGQQATGTLPHAVTGGMSIMGVQRNAYGDIGFTAQAGAEIFDGRWIASGNNRFTTVICANTSYPRTQSDINAAYLTYSAIHIGLPVDYVPTAVMVD